MASEDHKGEKSAGQGQKRGGERVCSEVSIGEGPPCLGRGFK